MQSVLRVTPMRVSEGDREREMPGFVLSLSVAVLRSPPVSQCCDALVLSGEKADELRKARVGWGEGSRAGRCLDGQG